MLKRGVWIAPMSYYLLNFMMIFILLGINLHMFLEFMASELVKAVNTFNGVKVQAP